MSEFGSERQITMNQHLQTTSLPLPVVVTNSGPQGQSSHRESSSSHRSSRRGHRHRSRSSSRRSRNRQRHSRRGDSHHSCLVYCKNDDRNFAAAACSMISIVLLATALEPGWIYLSGGKCHQSFDAPGTLKSLSTAQFFFNGHFYKNYAHSEKGDTVYKFGSGPNDYMVNCVTYPVVLMFKSCIALNFIAVITSFVSFLLDLIGSKYHCLSMIGRNAVFNIITVLLCIIITLFNYWITAAVNKLQLQHLLHEGSRVTVTFGVSFYLVTAAGVMSVMATTCNCLLRQSHPFQSDSCNRSCEHQGPYFDDTEALLPPLSSPDEPVVSPELSPPAYTP